MNTARPLYESKEDEDRELAFKKRIEERKGVVLHKLPISYRLDFMVMTKDRKVIAFAETKCRQINSTDHDTYILSANKWSTAMKYTKHLGYMNASGAITSILFLLFVSFLDGDYYYKHEGYQPTVLLGGRKEARDSADIEPVVHLPMTMFKGL